jgi:hypothetical protein
MKLRARKLLLGGVLLSVLAACGGGARVPAAGPGAPAAASAVERFLQLARQKDYVQMGWVFGTADGPFIESHPRPETERRMYGLAVVLQNDSFTVGTGSPVPGRIGRAESFSVRLQRGSIARRVPITTVLGRDRRWYVEIVDVEAITNGP